MSYSVVSLWSNWCVISLLSTLGEAWAQLKKSLAEEAEVHLKFSSKVLYYTGLCSLHKENTSHFGNYFPHDFSSQYSLFNIVSHGFVTLN